MWKRPALNLTGKGYPKRVGYMRGQRAAAPVGIGPRKVLNSHVDIIKGKRNRGRSKGRGKRSGGRMNGPAKV